MSEEPQTPTKHQNGAEIENKTQLDVPPINIEPNHDDNVMESPRLKVDLKAIKNHKERHENKDQGYATSGVEVELDGWIECTQEGTTKKFYYNINTKRTTWIRPVQGAIPIASPRATKTPNTERKVDGPTLEERLSKKHRSGVHSDSISEQEHSKLMGEIGEHEKKDNKNLKKMSVVVMSDITNARRNSDSVFSEAKVVTFYNLQGDPIQFTATLTDILKNVDLTWDDKLVYSGKYTLVNYAKEHLQKLRIKVFIFSRDMKPEEMISWNKTPIDKTFHPFANTKDLEIASNCHKIILSLIRNNKELDCEQVKKLIDSALAQVNVRNEVILLTLKECNGNPNLSEEKKAFELLLILMTVFPPTKHQLLDALIAFLHDLQHKFKGHSFEEYIKCCLQRFRRTIVTGPRKTCPKEKMLAVYAQPKDPLPLFGVSIEEYFAWQQKNVKDINAPYVLKIITDHMKKINGFTTEGLFRLPGDFEKLEILKDKFGQGDFAIDCDDPHVLASLFKLWLRELSEPLIPKSFYEKCLEAADNIDAGLQLIQDIPKLNCSVIVFVCQFLAENVLVPEVIQQTKMDYENIAVVFTPNFLRNSDITNPKDIMKNAPLEKKFVKNLLFSAKPHKKK